MKKPKKKSEANKVAGMKVKVEFPPLMMPVCLVGADVSGKPNFQAIAWFTFLESRPVMLGFASGRMHYTVKGVKQNKTFSINVPSSDMVVATDFCGLHSGSRVDKSHVFDVFYGELKTAPMISQCPVNIECKVVKMVKFVRDEFIVGEAAATYVQDSCLTNGKPDMTRIDSLLYGGHPPAYWRLGGKIAEAFSIGRRFSAHPKRK